MSAAQCRAARRKNLHRYGGARRKRSISEIVQSERIKSARMAAAKGKKK